MTSSSSNCSRLARRLGHQAAQRVIEIAQALAVLGRDLDRFAEPKLISFHRAGVAVLAFALVGDQDHRLVGAAREIGEGAVVRRQPGAGIDHEHHAHRR